MAERIRGRPIVREDIYGRASSQAAVYIRRHHPLVWRQLLADAEQWLRNTERRKEDGHGCGDPAKRRHQPARAERG